MSGQIQSAAHRYPEHSGTAKVLAVAGAGFPGSPGCARMKQVNN
jgi:hypothetical protein